MKRVGIGGLFIFLLGALMAATNPVLAASGLCGEGSAPDYGFTYDLRQPHWTVGWENYVSEETVNQVDAILDRMNEGATAQTMLLFKPQAEVGTRVNCAVHFLRYMQLGLPDGPRKDNGFVFLIVVEPSKIDVHYGVGLGLPALTAPDLTSLNRKAEEVYQTSGSMDQALLALVEGFDEYASAKYPPIITPTPTAEVIELPPLPEGPLGIVTLCCLVCIGLLALIFVIWLLIQLSRWGIFDLLNSLGGGSGGGGGSWGSGGGSWGRGSGGGGGGGGFRGGSGSGRAGRGN